MGIMVRFGRRKAFLRRGNWFSSDQDLERQLADSTDEWFRQTGGPPLEEKNHELAVARAIADRMGGRIACRTPGSSPKTTAIYISRRQMRFDFSRD